jgi:hypothetical protein
LFLFCQTFLEKRQHRRFLRAQLVERFESCSSARNGQGLDPLQHGLIANDFSRFDFDSEMLSPTAPVEGRALRPSRNAGPQVSRIGPDSSLFPNQAHSQPYYELNAFSSGSVFVIGASGSVFAVGARA